MTRSDDNDAGDASGRPSSGKGRLTGEAIRWSSRFDPADATPDDAGADDPAPSRNPERGWGAVLLTAGLLVTVAASGLAYSVLAGGLLGLFSVWTVSLLAAVLTVLGVVGLFQGWRAYRGR